MLFDLPLAELRVYKPEREEAADFDAFWAGTLADARRHDLAAVFELLQHRRVTRHEFAFAMRDGELYQPAGVAGEISSMGTIVWSSG